MATGLPPSGIDVPLGRPRLVLDGKSLDSNPRLMLAGDHPRGSTSIEIEVSTRPYLASRVTG